MEELEELWKLLREDQKDLGPVELRLRQEENLDRVVQKAPLEEPQDEPHDQGTIEVELGFQLEEKKHAEDVGDEELGHVSKQFLVEGDFVCRKFANEENSPQMEVEFFLGFEELFVELLVFEVEFLVALCLVWVISLQNRPVLEHVFLVVVEGSDLQHLQGRVLKVDVFPQHTQQYSYHEDS